MEAKRCVCIAYGCRKRFVPRGDGMPFCSSHVEARAQAVEGREREGRMRRLIYISGWHRTLSYESRKVLLKNAREGKAGLPTSAQLDRIAQDYFASCHAHQECFVHFSEYGTLYPGAKDDTCEVCGRPLMCNGVIRKHNYGGVQRPYYVADHEHEYRPLILEYRCSVCGDEYSIEGCSGE